MNNKNKRINTTIIIGMVGNKTFLLNLVIKIKKIIRDRNKNQDQTFSIVFFNGFLFSSGYFSLKFIFNYFI